MASMIAADPAGVLGFQSFDRWQTCLHATADAVQQHTLIEYILEGPLLEACGLQPADVLANIASWEQLGLQLCEQLKFDASNLLPHQKERVYHYYLPVYFWIKEQLQQHRSQQQPGTHSALVVGMSAPQGCGKSTLVEQLQLLLQNEGLRVAGVSIDDFYLTYEQQSALAAAHPNNALLQYRGNAGSHDLQLGEQTLQQLRNLGEGEMALPRYNKSAHSGRGDRADPSTWPKVEGPLDVVLFEGWMLGFSPTSDDAVAAVDPQLRDVNRALRAYGDAWDKHVDCWIVIKVANPEWVYKWRLQAETVMRSSGKPGMTDEQVADFVSRYMPAYKAYLPGLYDHGPCCSDAARTVVVEVNENRSPVPRLEQ